MASAGPQQRDLTSVRRHLHALAELSGQEETTAEFLAEELDRCRPDRLLTGLGGHGVAAVFEGGDRGPRVLLRSDIDALPIPDRTDLEHASRTEGVSHKCGHDGHMTMLLGAARSLADARPDRGSAVLLFQPAEETGAGARRVLDDPAFAEIEPDRVLGVHNLPGFPLGAVILRPGSFAAASRGLTIELTGATSHAGEPQAGRSPVLAVASLIQSLSALPQFEAGLHQGAKATVVGIDVGGPAFGTSPGRGRLMVTLRALADPVMERLVERCRRLATTTAAAHGLKCETTWTDLFPPTDNDPDSVEAIARACRQAQRQVIERDRPFPWSEDFGHFTAAYPGLLVGLGAGRKRPNLHHPDYDFPDRLLGPGVEFWELSLAALLAMP